MAVLNHVYATAHGEYTIDKWIGEHAQIGLRLPFVDVLSAPAKGATFTPAANGDVTLDSGVSTSTHGSLARTWTARLGQLGSTQNCNDVVQMDIAEDLWTFLDAIKAYTYNGFRWLGVKLAPVTPGGAYGAPASTYSFTTPIAGTATTQFAPTTAVAVTLRAPIIGKRGRGRFYLPAVAGSSANNDGTIGNALQSAVRAATVQMINDVQNLPGTPENIPIVSVGSADSATFVRPSAVRIGSHYDTQRRRQAQVPEVYSETAL